MLRPWPEVAMPVCRRLSSLPVALLVMLAACHDPPTAPARITQLPRSLSASEQEIIDASNRFAFELLREVNRRWADSNVFIAPLSATMALAMTLNGARGETFEAMRSTLGYSELSLEQINASARSLIDLLRGLDPRVDFRIANSVWYRQGFPFDQPFFDVVGEHFDAEVGGRDFADPHTIVAINAWVDRATNGKITTIIDQISDEIVMFLINAIYFEGTWQYTFDSDQTRADEFVRRDGSRVAIKMMRLEGNLSYFEHGGMQVVDLPYGGGAYSMSVLLPAAGQDVDAILATLDAARWNEIITGFAERRVGLELPKFRLEWEDTLNAPLSALGMEVAFHPYLADFSGMSSSHGHDLYISFVKQKAFVDVNEEGTEAAAATAVGVGVVCACPPAVTPVRVDRPFAFLIRERYSGALLFVAKIMDPPAG